jgi:hypothetical protein
MGSRGTLQRRGPRRAARVQARPHRNLYEEATSSRGIMRPETRRTSASSSVWIFLREGYQRVFRLSGEAFSPRDALHECERACTCDITRPPPLVWAPGREAFSTRDMRCLSTSALVFILLRGGYKRMYGLSEEPCRHAALVALQVE